MSENIVSQHMTLEDGYGSRMYPVMSKPDSSMENILMESQGSLNFSSTQPQLAMPNIQGLQSNQQLRVDVSQEMSESHFEVKPLDPMGNNTVPQQILVPNWKMQQMQTHEFNSGEQKSLLVSKRKAALEPLSNGPNTKRVAQPSSLFSSSGMPALSVPSKKVIPMGSMSNSPRSMPSSKKKLPDSVNRPQSNAQKNRNVQPAPPTKAQFGSSYTVRSKLRESLAAALALVCQELENPSNAEKNDQSLVGSKELDDSVTPRPASDTRDASAPDPRKVGEPAAATLSCPIEECRNTNSSSETVDDKHIAEDTTESWKFVGQEFQSNPVLTYEDASFNDGFFGKDELLLGNGLSWAMELNGDMVDVKEEEVGDTAKLATYQDTGDDKKSNLSCSEPLPCPEALASEIEAELFKFFGGVNKKYKEKGRSLLFNLKDKSNPELRERVMSGEITPEKLCSMSAEELASKELSEWRIAKAEELALMKVLPDTGVDLRRLVKKTHKGEFEVVEMERDVTAPVELSVSASTRSVDQPQDNRKKAERSRDISPVQAAKTEVREDPANKSKTEELDGQCQLTIPNDGGDVLHVLMVDDMKDLPPIVSLDEFMDSLDKEPPFENLHGDSGTIPGSGKETSDVGDDTNSSDQTSKDPGKKTQHRSDEVDSKNTVSNNSVKSTLLKKRPVIYPASGSIRGELTWEGLLQLSISSTANFVGLYKSGEKTSTKEWPRFIEIKGRVRLDAFQKFLQDLPMSRSRAVMVVHFALTEGCSDNDRKNLQELADSYDVEQRLGFAEPSPGFEIYFIPPQTATLEMISKHLAKDFTEILKTIDIGLIGIVVWRKAHLTPTTDRKDNAKRQQQQPYYSATTASSRLPEKDMFKSNANLATRSVAPSSFMSRSQPVNNNVDDDDDVPPGFGPPTTKREDDDLPEFKFSGGGRGGLSPPFNPPAPQRLSSPTPSRSVDQVRLMIQKYGKGENDNVPSLRGGIALQPWDDDDDDIPEWQPDAPPPAQPQVLPPPPPMLPAHMANLAQLQQQPLMPLAKPMGGGNSGNPNAGWWPGNQVNMQPSNLRGQDQGRQWRSDEHRSRGRGY